jgi:hypothetical protein
MIAGCARRWPKEDGSLGKSLTTFVVSLGVVVFYDSVLFAWFWHMIPNAGGAQLIQTPFLGGSELAAAAILALVPGCFCALPIY